MLYNNELCNLYISSENINVVKYVSSLGKQQMDIKFSYRILLKISYLEDHSKQY
jgi:hypothetical protein